MAQESSFDIVCELDLQEVDNALQQVMKEIRTRYDFKGSRSEVRREGAEITLLADDETRRRSVVDLLTQRLAARKVSLKGVTFGRPEEAAGGSLRQKITLQQGIPTEQARAIVKLIKDSDRKVQAAIQGESVRVRGKNKDDLQAVIQLLRSSDLPIAMQFVNYR
jgi:hypothetical protein